jgi:hypothetical protein
MKMSNGHEFHRPLEQLPVVEGDGETRAGDHRGNVANGASSPLERIAAALERLADHLAPEPDNIVGTDYVARRMGCTPTHVTRLARDGSIPLSCVIPGCGDGRPWKFLRDRIDRWLEVR